MRKIVIHFNFNRCYKIDLKDLLLIPGKVEMYEEHGCWNNHLQHINNR